MMTTPSAAAIKPILSHAEDLIRDHFMTEVPTSALPSSTPGGTITWKLYENEECKGTPAAEDSLAVTNGNATHETPKGATLGSVGTYYWVASYSGDHNNSATKSGCEAEPVEVTPAGPAIKTTQASAADPAAAVFNALALHAALPISTPGGTITWKLYENEECK